MYTSDCSSKLTMTATWIGGIGKSTGWPGPGATSGNTNETATLGPDSGSCNTVEDTSDRVSVGFDVKADLDKIGASASNITFRVWEDGNTNLDDHKQLTNNPTLEVIYTDTPNTPTGLRRPRPAAGRAA